MSESLKKQFDEMLAKMKSDSSGFHFFENEKEHCFFVPDGELSNRILLMHKRQMKLESLMKELTPFQIAMVRQTCMLDEIQSTNSTENIYSTRSDIFGAMKNVKSIRNKKIISVLNSYRMIAENSESDRMTVQEIRNLYDHLMQGAHERTSDKPDGEIFRKDTVHITNGIKSVHEGFYPEEKIIRGMGEYADLYEEETLDIYYKIILGHYLLETIHPFYDGNGRLGRFLMSKALYEEEHTVYAFAIATAINRRRKRYYNALETARDVREFGCLNEYVSLFIDILSEGITDLIAEISSRKKRVEESVLIGEAYELTKSEKKVFDLLLQASVFTYFGICNEEIMMETGLSKRTMISTMNKFKELELLEEHKMGKTVYHKLRIVEGLKDTEPELE